MLLRGHGCLCDCLPMWSQSHCKTLVLDKQSSVATDYLKTVMVDSYFSPRMLIPTKKLNCKPLNAVIMLPCIRSVPTGKRVSLINLENTVHVCMPMNYRQVIFHRIPLAGTNPVLIYF